MRFGAVSLAAALVLCGSLLPLRAATVTRGPYLQLGTPDSIVVRWSTDVPTSSEVRYGTSPGDLDESYQSETERTEHEWMLTGLLPDTRYYYSVGTSTEVLAGGDTEHFFVTHPVPGTNKPTRIWVLGDSGTGSQAAKDVRDAYYTYVGGDHTDLMLHLGDVSQLQGTDEQYQTQFFDIYAAMLRKSVLWPTQGNHDAVNSDWNTQTGPYYDMFSLPSAAEAGGMVSGTEAYYSFDYANVHFVILNSMINFYPYAGFMFDWLEQDLAATDQDWIIAYWHHPPYSKGAHDSDDPADSSGRLIFFRENALPILEAHGVDLMLSGHSHSYERSYLINGHYGFSSEFASCDDAGTPGEPSDDFCANSPQTQCPGGLLDCDLGGFLVDAGDGRVDGDGPYEKPLLGPQSHEGAVYAVAGSSGMTSPGLFGHPAIFVHFLTTGSMVLNLDAERLDARFLDSTGAILDEFTIVKDSEPVVDFTANPLTGPAPLSVAFTDLSLTEGTEWAWDFNDDGSVDSAEQHPTHLYTETGWQSVRLTLTSVEGTFEKVKPQYINVFLAPPAAQFIASTVAGVAPLSVNFTDLSQNLPSQWEWDLDGDGIVDSTAQNPSFVYAEPGVFTVKLTASNDAGSDVETKTSYVVVVPPVPGEITGLVLDSDRSTISWDSLPDACSYDVVKGDLLQLRASGDLSISQLGCLEESVSSSQTMDFATPEPGQGFFYLVRGVSCTFEAGTYDTSSARQLTPRDPALQGPAAACACHPTDDTDGDGFCSALDNCPGAFNVDQQDTDTDTFGDACDCDIFNANCTTDCTNADDDDFCVTTDCDDVDAGTFPGAAPNDDEDACMKDSDDDDWGDESPSANVAAGSDCNDNDAAIHPETTWHQDLDGDGFGSLVTPLVQCEQPAAFVLDSTDCDDTSPTAATSFPGAAPNDGIELCLKDADGDDWGDSAPPAGVMAGSDCDDDSVTAAVTFPGAAPNDSADGCMKDGDGDDWGDDNPAAGVGVGTDCNDDDAAFNPDTTWYADTDNDGFGDPAATLMQCLQPTDYLLDASDCDDRSATAASTYPGAAPNDSASACMKDVDGDDWGDDNPSAGVDAGTDCDDGDAVLTPDTTWYADTDDDGFGDPTATLVQCLQPTDHVLDGTDCDDTSATAADTFPGAAPNDSPSACMLDVDGDDWGDDTPPAGVVAGTDCNDGDAVLNPDTTWHADTDDDGFGDSVATLVQCQEPVGYLLDNTDCDDTSATAADTFPGAAPNDSADACMKDVDGDDWGDDNPSAGVGVGTDCNDDDAAFNPDTTWYADTDNDGFGDPAATLMQCLQPTDYLLDASDCDDRSATAASTYPGAAPNDSASACMKDVDGDDWGDDNPSAGVDAGTDCDDGDAVLNPDTAWYADTDDDGFGDPTATLVQCLQPTDHVLDETDCDDTSATAADTFPGAAPNDSPSACMLDVDGDDWGDDTPPAGVVAGTDCNDGDAVLNPDTTWHADTDDDGFGDSVATLVQCQEPVGYLLDNTDCDDTSATAADTFPGAAPNDSADACMKDVDGDDWGDDNPSVGVGVGTDCNDGDAAFNPDTTWYVDTDGDEFGNAGFVLVQCLQADGFVLDSTDCDDTSPTAVDTFPGAAPNDNTLACLKDADHDDWGDSVPPAGVPSGTDCDDTNPEINPTTAWYADTDEDGFGNAANTVEQCRQPAGFVLDSTDCDDTSPTAAQTFPGAAPDDDPLACMTDRDGDQWGDAAPLAAVTPGTDCDDRSATAVATFPGAAPNDSAGACMKDVDGDNWGDDFPPAGVTAGTDCDDANSRINQETAWYADTDSDGFGAFSVSLVQCTQPAGFVLDGTDCDDASPTAAATFPGAAPHDSYSGCLKDVDGDDWADDSPPAGVTAGSDCNDADPDVSPDTIWYADIDGDGFGDLGLTLAQCEQPAAHLLDNTDCDDTSPTAAATFPGAAPNDGIQACLKDFDGDDWGDVSPPAGVTAGSDCDDDSVTAVDTFPGAAPNDSAAGCLKDSDGDDWGDDAPPAGVTQGSDCDDADSGIHPETTWYADTDGDGFGDPGVDLVQCLQPVGYVLEGTDCDDTSPTAADTYPGAAEQDRSIACMKDSDDDDWGDATPPGGVIPGTDCDDTNPDIHPDTKWYADTDGDGFGDDAVSDAQCEQPVGFVLDSTDCDDSSPTAAQTFPGAAPNDDPLACMRDRDGDHWGDGSPDAGVTPGTDCDDGSATAAQTFPGAAPNDSNGACLKDIDGDDWGDDSPPVGVPAGTDCDDDDPDLSPDTTWYADADGDGFGDVGVTLARCIQPAEHVMNSTDCDDTSPTAAETFPGAAFDENSIACMKDSDGDEWGDDNPPAGVTAGTDCDDGDPGLNPNTLWFADTDGDGFGDPGVGLAQCLQPAGYLANSADCDDTSGAAAETFPGAAPNDSAEACMKDLDGDDWGDVSPPAAVSAGTDCNDGDSDLWTLPGAVSNLVVHADKESFSWSGPVELGGAPGTLEYGLLRADRPDKFTEDVLCIPAADSTSTADSEIPLSGEAFFYLSRAANGCGEGSLGTNSGGVERVGSSCP